MRTLFAFALMLGAAQAGEAVVVDGDTFVLDKQVIRLDGIDAPELRQVCRDNAGRPYRCGLAAARKLEALVIGKDVNCTPTGRDRYSRITSICTAGGKAINEEMVRSGWAVDYARYSRGRFATVEAQAREAKRGLWRGPFDRPEAWRRSHNGRSQ